MLQQPKRLRSDRSGGFCGRAWRLRAWALSPNREIPEWGNILTLVFGADLQKSQIFQGQRIARIAQNLMIKLSDQIDRVNKTYLKEMFERTY